MKNRLLYPARNLLDGRLYERVRPEFATRFWMKLAYFDYARREGVMVAWPLNYLVQIAWWANIKWSQYRHAPSWIDRELEKQNHRQLERIEHRRRTREEQSPDYALLAWRNAFFIVLIAVILIVVLSKVFS